MPAAAKVVVTAVVAVAVRHPRVCCLPALRMIANIIAHCHIIVIAITVIITVHPQVVVGTDCGAVNNMVSIVSQPVSQSVSRSGSQPVSQSVSQSASQSVSQSVSQ
jgi:hypothetical protein